MTVLIVGSTALNQYIPIEREPVDLDIIGHPKDVIRYITTEISGEIHQWIPTHGGRKLLVRKGGTIIEAELAYDLNTSECILIDEELKNTNDVPCLWASLNTLYWLKMSHRYLRNSPHFTKTMDDIHLIRSEFPLVTLTVPDWYMMREEETYNYLHPRLNGVTKDEFFTDYNLTYTYDHDSVHKAVAMGRMPAYTYYKVDQEEVECSEKLFFQLPEIIRLRGVCEEAMVLAIERSLVPHPGVLTPRQAFDMALMKVCTSITSGWFREYAWEHYHIVRAMMPSDYWGHFQLEVEAGRVMETSVNWVFTPEDNSTPDFTWEAPNGEYTIWGGTPGGIEVRLDSNPIQTAFGNFQKAKDFCVQHSSDYHERKTDDAKTD